MFQEIKRILVVDDEPEFVKTISRHLRREGFLLCSACDGKKAREQISDSIAQGSPIQVVITDVLMPRMDGVGLLEWIKRKHPEISVLMVSGFADTITTEKLIRPELDEYCQKPFTPSQMMILLGRIGQKRKGWSCLESWKD